MHLLDYLLWLQMLSALQEHLFCVKTLLEDKSELYT